jgi:tetratricopeptide (TPR) repeat protein
MRTTKPVLFVHLLSLVVAPIAGLLTFCGLVSGGTPPETDSGPGLFSFSEGSSSHADLYRRASEYLEDEENKEAQLLYRHLIALEPESANGYIGLGTALSLQDRYEAATDAYDRALGIAPDSIEALIGMGSAKLRLNQYDTALDYYKRALALDGENLSALGRQEEALQHLQRIIDLAPGSTYAGEAEKLMGRFEEGGNE